MQPQHAPRLEVAGNQTTMNLPPALYQNIQTCKYFKDLYEYKTYHEVLDEIKRTVSYMEPYVPNVSVRNTPSSCFCLLFKLFLMRLTVKQMKGMLSSKDNPYLKAMGLLYLRLTLPGSELWKWFEGMMEDQDEFQAKRQGPPMTIGKLARILLTEQKWFDIVLPRLQVGPARQLEEHLREYDRQKRSSTASSSPSRRRRSPPRYGSRSRSRSRSPSRSPQRRRRSRSPQYRRRSPERRRRSRSPPYDRHRRSRSRSPPYDRHRRSPPRRKSPSPERKRRSPSPPSEAVAAAVASFTAPPKQIQSAAEMQKLRARYGDASGALEGPASLGKFNTLKPDTIIPGSSQKK